jgi:hypothetical protein
MALEPKAMFRYASREPSGDMLETPLAMFVFNRPDLAQRVFDEVARARPRKLLFVADGARNEAEWEQCNQTRALINQVNWDCEVLTNFSDVNLGCRYRFKSGLDWVFENCEEAIILEDDCLPRPSFFRFCTELLDKYRHDERIMLISGDNFQFGRQRTENSYYFSRLVHIWGWASWRRAWQLYDTDMQHWPELRETGWLESILKDRRFVDHWRLLFDVTYSKELMNVWDYQMTFACWLHDRLNIVPERNLIRNIGFGEQATNTKDVSKFANLPASEMAFPLKHPQTVERNEAADRFTFEQLVAVDNPNIFKRIKGRLGQVFARAT